MLAEPGAPQGHRDIAPDSGCDRIRQLLLVGEAIVEDIHLMPGGRVPLDHRGDPGRESGSAERAERQDRDPHLITGADKRFTARTAFFFALLPSMCARRMLMLRIPCTRVESGTSGTACS